MINADKFTRIIFIFYVLSSINFIFYNYSLYLQIIFILFQFSFVLISIKKKFYISWILVVYWGCFLILIGLSTVLSDYKNEILLSGTKFIILTMLQILIVGFIFERCTEKILKFFVPFSIILSMYSIILYTFFPKIVYTSLGLKANQINILGLKFNQFIYGMKGDYGYASFTNNPNVFGFIVAIGLNVYNSQAYIKQCSSKNKFKRLIINCLLISGIILSNSRAALIVAIIMFYTRFMLEIYFKKKKGKLLFLIINNIFATVLLIVGTFKKDIILSLIESISDTNGRTDIWIQLLGIALEKNTFIGQGYGSISNVLIDSPTITNYSAFNSYLSVFVELGGIGFCFFIGWIMYTSILLFRNMKFDYIHNFSKMKWDIMVFSMLIAVYVVSMVENKLMNSSFFHLLWIIITFEIVKDYKDNKEKNKINKELL